MTMVNYTLNAGANCYNGEYRHSGFLEFSWSPQKGLQKGIWQCSGKREVAIKGDITNISFSLGKACKDKCLINNLAVLNQELQTRFRENPLWVNSDKLTIVITSMSISINGQDIKVRSKSQEPKAVSANGQDVISEPKSQASQPAISAGARNRGVFSRMFCCVPRRESEENRPILAKS